MKWGREKKTKHCGLTSIPFYQMCRCVRAGFEKSIVNGQCYVTFNAPLIQTYCSFVDVVWFFFIASSFFRFFFIICLHFVKQQNDRKYVQNAGFYFIWLEHLFHFLCHDAVALLFVKVDLIVCVLVCMRKDLRKWYVCFPFSTLDKQ